MAVMNQQGQIWTARRIIAELPFIPAASNWLKLLLSLLAEPLMFVSSLYIVAETVIPGAANWSGPLTNGTNTVMSLAPEIILPGCFQQAQHAMVHENKVRAYLLYGLCILFGTMTLLTLASFVWHFTEIVGGALLFIRCGSGIGYTIILNISGPDTTQTQQPQRLHPPADTVDKAQFDQLTDMVNRLATQVTQVTQNTFILGGNGHPTLPEVSLSTSSRQTIHEESPVDMAVDSRHTDPALEAARPPCLQVVYPQVPGFSPEKVKRILDAHLAGTPWREIGNYSRDVKPVRAAWEALYTERGDNEEK